MTAVFEKYINYTLLMEGAKGEYTHIVRNGIEVDPPTKYGITSWKVREHKLDNNCDGVINAEDVKLLTLDQALAIYQGDYWLPVYDKIAERSETIAAKVFDTGVNAGPPVGCKMFQQALNMTGKGDILLVDGKLGSKTLSVFTAFVLAGRESEILKNFCDAQMGFYERIIARKPQKAMFRDGWRKRAYGIPEPNLSLENGRVMVDVHEYISLDDFEVVDVPSLDELLAPLSL